MLCRTHSLWRERKRKRERGAGRFQIRGRLNPFLKVWGAFHGLIRRLISVESSVMQGEVSCYYEHLREAAVPAEQSVSLLLFPACRTTQGAVQVCQKSCKTSPLEKKERKKGASRGL